MCFFVGALRASGCEPAGYRGGVVCDLFGERRKVSVRGLASPFRIGSSVVFRTPPRKTAMPTMQFVAAIFPLTPHATLSWPNNRHNEE